MNKIGIYYAFWTHNWDADFVPFVHKVKRLGFDVLEVNAGTVTAMTRRERERLRAAAEEASIELTYCIGLPAKYDIASPDASVRRAGVAFLKQTATALHEMGHTQLGGIIYGTWPGRLPPGQERSRYATRSIRSLREVMKVAEDRGVCFNLEVVNRFEQFLFNTAAEAVAFVEQIDSPACRLLLDTFHLNIEEDDLAAAIRTAGRRLGHFHIGETNRRAPGRGRMPWGEIFGALRRIRYQGIITMEPFLMPGGDVGRDISVYRDLQDGCDLDREAARALRFVRRKLAA